MAKLNWGQTIFFSLVILGLIAMRVWVAMPWTEPSERATLEMSVLIRPLQTYERPKIPPEKW